MVMPVLPKGFDPTSPANVSREKRGDSSCVLHSHHPRHFPLSLSSGRLSYYNGHGQAHLDFKKDRAGAAAFDDLFLLSFDDDAFWGMLV